MPALAVGAARATTPPVVHLYDVRVTGTLESKFLLPAKPLPLDLGWKETSTWVETYNAARLTVQPSVYPEGGVELKLEARGTIAGTIAYSTTGPGPKSCKSITRRPAPARLTIVGTPYGASSGGRTYRLSLSTGRRPSSTGSPVHPPGCSYYANPRWVRIGQTALRRAPGSVVTGLLDTRATSLTVEYHSPQQSGALGFPLGALEAGNPFAIRLTGSSTQQNGRFVSRGTARIAFAPHPS
jgi:hypothetical protein